jgi:hypothetical protein
MSTLFQSPDIPLSDIRSALELQDDPFIYIERQSRHLQRQIQSLLDAQSDGLLASMRSPGHANSDITSNKSSNTPLSAVGSPERGVRTIPVRQPPRKKTGLRAARKGILKSMSDLLSLREEERRLIQSRIQQRQDTIAEIDTFANKKERLEKTISDIENDREGKRARELKGEAKSLEQEIEELELKLADMKARHRHIIQEVSRIENSVDAKLSSYKESLSIVDIEISRYLGSPPLQPLRPDVDRSSFYSLHPKRRTLEMARDHWRTEQTELKERLHNVDLEIAALDDGGPLWQSVVKEISAFERRLKGEMQQSIILSKSMLPDVENLADQQEQGKRIIADLEITTRLIEEKLEVAEEKDWRLLVCSIGAELQALREAQSLLKQAFDYEQPTEGKESPPIFGTAVNNDNENNNNNDQSRTTKETKDTNSSTLPNPPPPTITIASEDDEHADEPPAYLLKDLMSDDVKSTSFRSEDEDDEPDPAWLLSDP